MNSSSMSRKSLIRSSFSNRSLHFDVGKTCKTQGRRGRGPLREGLKKPWLKHTYVAQTYIVIMVVQPG
jgi:hypothetical protein